MADEFADEQRELPQMWKKARKDGCMAPWQQAKVFGLKEAWKELHGSSICHLPFCGLWSKPCAGGRITRSTIGNKLVAAVALKNASKWKAQM